MFAVAAAAAAVIMSSLDVSTAAAGDLHFYCDKAVRHKYCGGGGNGAVGDGEWVLQRPPFCDAICLSTLGIALDVLQVLLVGP